MTALLKWRTAALYAIAALVAAGSLAAFAESYRGLYDWSREHGLSGFWAAAWPLQLDVFIAIGELALFVALVDAWSRRSRAAAWAVTIVGAAVSVAGNVGHVSGHDIASRLSAGVPPVAAACALFVALGVLKHVTAAARSAPATPPAEGQHQSPRPPVAEPVTLLRPARKAPRKAAARKAAGRPSDAERVAHLRALLEDGRSLTIDGAMEELKAGRPVAKRILEAAMAPTNGNGPHG